MTALLAGIIVSAVIAFVLWALSAPFRPGRAAGSATSTPADERRVLELAKEAKYSEIRDNEIDHRTGKLSDQDFRALDRQLRAEAVEILRALDGLGEEEAGVPSVLHAADRAAGQAPASG